MWTAGSKAFSGIGGNHTPECRERLEGRTQEVAVTRAKEEVQHASRNCLAHPLENHRGTMHVAGQNIGATAATHEVRLGTPYAWMAEWGELGHLRPAEMHGQMAGKIARVESQMSDCTDTRWPTRERPDAVDGRILGVVRHVKTF